MSAKRTATENRQPDGWAALRRQITTDGERTLWACLLEATAVKAGNVHPMASFSDLTYSDFLTAAQAIAPVMDEDMSGLGDGVLSAVRATRGSCRSNVNLGIILLLVPLTLASRRMKVEPAASSRDDGERLRACVEATLAEISARDGECVYQAIREANPGGLGEARELDVRTTTEVDLLTAMRAAADRDLIAQQYDTGFATIFEHVVPVLRDALDEHGDWLAAIGWGQVTLLAAMPDTLIARKGGERLAEETRRRAAAVMKQPNGEPREAAWRELDHWLRADGHRRNPGAIADLMAAGIWVLLHANQ